MSRPGAQDFVPDTDSLAAPARAAGGCQGCDLYEHADRTVFGRAPATSRLLLVGEQPGDVENREGHGRLGHQRRQAPPLQARSRWEAAPARQAHRRAPVSIPHALATIHPSAALRAPAADRARRRDELVSDLRAALALL